MLHVPSAFSTFFTLVENSIIVIHNLHLKVLLSYYFTKARINYGKFNIRFYGPKVWDSIDLA